MLYENSTKMNRHQNPAGSYLSSLVLLLIALFIGVANSAEQDVPYWCNVVSLKCHNKCPDGRQWTNGCPTCECRSALCVEIGCSESERCTVVRRKNVYNIFGDVAVCEPYSAPAPLTIIPNSVRAAQDLGSCDFQGRCDVTGTCPANSECRSGGRCCRIYSRDDVNSITNSKIPRCLQEPRVGHCRALGTQFVYNVTTGRCEEMLFGGCVASGNSFATKGECEQVCEHPCKKPRTTGRCRASITRFYFNEYSQKCEAFEFGGCLGNGNNFLTAGECEEHCKGLRRGRVLSVGGEIPVRSLEQLTTPAKASTGNEVNDARKSFQRGILDNYSQLTTVQNRGKSGLGPGDDNKMVFRPRPNPDVRRQVVPPVPQVDDSFEQTTPEPYTPPKPQTHPKPQPQPQPKPQPKPTARSNTVEENELLQSIAKHLRSRPESTRDEAGGSQVTFKRQRSRSSTGDSFSNRGYPLQSKDDEFTRSQRALMKLLHG